MPLTNDSTEFASTQDTLEIRAEARFTDFFNVPSNEGTFTMSDILPAGRSDFSELDRLKIAELVDETVEKHKKRFYAFAGFLAVLYGFVSTLVLWSVQNSGKLAGEQAATTAVQCELLPQLDDIRQVSKEANVNIGKIDAILKQAIDLKSKSNELENDIKSAREFIDKSLTGISTKLANNKDFKDTVTKQLLEGLEKYKELNELHSKIDATESKVESLSKFNNDNFKVVGENFHLKTVALYIWDVKSKSFCQINPQADRSLIFHKSNVDLDNNKLEGTLGKVVLDNP